jgi:hypothetical protein
MALLGLLSFGCHGTSAAGKMRFVNQADSKKVMEFTLENPGVLARVHMAFFNARVRGRYVLSDADSRVEGRVTQDEKGYTLESGDGSKKHFGVENAGSLKDEDGGIWKLDNPSVVTLKTTLKEW